MAFNSDNPNKIQINTKVCQDLHDIIDELSNHRTGGNMSGLVREIIEEWLEYQKSETMPPKVQMKVAKRIRDERERFEIELYEEYLKEQKRPDPKYAKTLEENAKSIGIPWPPQPIDLPMMLPRYKGILDHLKENNGSSTLREMCRVFNLNKDELLERLSFLLSTNKIQVDDVVDNRTTNVYLVEDKSAANGNHNELSF